MSRYHLFVILVLQQLNSIAQTNSSELTAYNSLRLSPVGATITIPPYKIIDTVIYGGPEPILRYELKSKDNSLKLIISIDDYSSHTNAPYNFQLLTENLRHKILQNNYSKVKCELITEDSILKDGVKIGYLKYLIRDKLKTFFEAQIYFIRDKRVFRCWLYEKKKKTAGITSSQVDAIYKSLVVW